MDISSKNRSSSFIFSIVVIHQVQLLLGFFNGLLVTCPLFLLHLLLGLLYKPLKGGVDLVLTFDGAFEEVGQWWTAGRNDVFGNTVSNWQVEGFVTVVVNEGIPCCRDPRLVETGMWLVLLLVSYRSRVSSCDPREGH